MGCAGHSVAAKAEEVTLAWQTPGYVIEEIVVTAPRVVSLPTDLRTPAVRPSMPEPDVGEQTRTGFPGAFPGSRLFVSSRPQATPSGAASATAR
jgi:hypothetical protein